MKKIIIAAAVGGCLALAGAAPAFATDEPVAPEYHTVLWKITTDSPDVFLTPQEYIATFEGDNTSYWVGSSELECGTRYQADAYLPEHIPGLIEDGLLHGGEDGGIAHHWLVFTTDECVEVPPTEEPPVEEPPVVQPPVEQPPVVDVPVSDVQPELVEAGAEVTVAAIAAGLLLLVGGGILFAKRVEARKIRA